MFRITQKDHLQALSNYVGEMKPLGRQEYIFFKSQFCWENILHFFKSEPKWK